METIYVLTEGEYSDYHIVALFSSREKAEEACALYPDSEIEEYKLNSLKIPEHPSVTLPGLRALTHGIIPLFVHAGKTLFAEVSNPGNIAIPSGLRQASTQVPSQSSKSSAGHLTKSMRKRLLWTSFISGSRKRSWSDGH